jgi:DNA-binding MarR family transcriptional regulator
MPRQPSRKPKAPNVGEERAWSVPGLREPRYSQSLERGLAILGCFTPDRLVLGIANIADELGMSRSTTHRYVITLVALGYLEQGASRKYRLGLKVTDLGTGKLKLRLTAAGKRLLKKAKQLKLTAKGTFTPTGKTATVTTRTFSLVSK